MNKRLFIYSIVSFCLFLTCLFLSTLTPAKQTTATQYIKQYYTVTAVNKTYIEVQSNTNKSEYTNFHYSDQINKESFSIGDKVAAYFEPNKNSYKIVDFRKVKPSLREQTFKVVSYSNNEYRAINTINNPDKPQLLFSQSDVKNSHSVSVGDTVTGVYKPMKDEDQFLYVK